MKCEQLAACCLAPSITRLQQPRWLVHASTLMTEVIPSRRHARFKAETNDIAAPEDTTDHMRDSPHSLAAAPISFLCKDVIV